MEYLKQWIISISAILILITAVEMIFPENSLKKYGKFVFGIILTIVIIKPVLSFLAGGQEDFTNKIKAYIANDSANESMITKEEDTMPAKTQLESSVQRLLKEKFSDMDFKVSLSGEMSNLDYKIKLSMVQVGVKDNGIKPIQKVDIKNEKQEDKYPQVRSYLKEILKVDDNKIKIYEME